MEDFEYLPEWFVNEIKAKSEELKISPASVLAYMAFAARIGMEPSQLEYLENRARAELRTAWKMRVSTNDA